MSGVEVSGVNGEDQWQKGWKAVTGSHTKKKKTYQDKMSTELSAKLSATVDSHEDRKSTRLDSSHYSRSRMPSSA